MRFKSNRFFLAYTGMNTHLIPELCQEKPVWLELFLQSVVLVDGMTTYLPKKAILASFLKSTTNAISNLLRPIAIFLEDQMFKINILLLLHLNINYLVYCSQKRAKKNRIYKNVQNKRITKTAQQRWRLKIILVLQKTAKTFSV